MEHVNFCPECGCDLRREDQSHGRVACPNCGHTVYFNPKPCAGALVVRDGRVMLTRRAIEPARGAWDIPGGFLGEGEHPEQCARRELREETGLDIQITGLLGIFMDTYGKNGRSTLNIYYLATVEADAEPRPADDVDQIQWFGPRELPSRLAFAHTREVLKLWCQSLE